MQISQRVYDIKQIKEDFKKIYGHYPPSIKSVQKAHDIAKQARRKAYQDGEPYRKLKKEYDVFDNICRFHEVKR